MRVADVAGNIWQALCWCLPGLSDKRRPTALSDPNPGTCHTVLTFPTRAAPATTWCRGTRYHSLP